MYPEYLMILCALIDNAFVSFMTRKLILRHVPQKRVFKGIYCYHPKEETRQVPANPSFGMTLSSDLQSAAFTDYIV